MYVVKLNLDGYIHTSSKKACFFAIFTALIHINLTALFPPSQISPLDIIGAFAFNVGGFPPK